MLKTRIGCIKKETGTLVDDHAAWLAVKRVWDYLFPHRDLVLDTNGSVGVCDPYAGGGFGWVFAAAEEMEVAVVAG